MTPQGAGMVATVDCEEIASRIAMLDREVVVSRLRHFDGRFPLDFDDAFIVSQSTDQLRHIYFAVCVQTECLPE